MIPPPRLKYSDLFAGLFFYIGLIMYLGLIHIVTIQTTGDVNSVMNTIFIVGVIIFMALFIFGMVYLLVLVMKWCYYLIITPAWQKNQDKGGKNV